MDVSVIHGYYEQFYPQQLLSKKANFQIYSSEDYFCVIVKKSHFE